MPTSNTPLPAQTLLALADAMLATREEVLCLRQNAKHEEFYRVHTAERESREAYRAARAASPVTLEEALIINEHRAWFVLKDAQLHFHATATEAERYHKAMQDRIEHARRLAGEGGGQ